MGTSTAILEQYQITDLATAGAIANGKAAAAAFADYRSRKAQRTLDRQDAELANFGQYVKRENLGNDPEAWRGVSWGIVDAFTKQMILDGYALGTVNNHLSTIKAYAKLAAKAGALDVSELAMIRTVAGYGHKEGKRMDDKRNAANIPTRRGAKKADFVTLSEEQEAALVGACDLATAQGRRDRVLLVLLLDLGLRVSEAAALATDDFDPATGALVVYRPKTDTTTRFTLQNGKLAAMRAYFENDGPTDQLLQGSVKGGRLEGTMSIRAIFSRVKTLGAALGIVNLSPHDLRHTRATRLAPKMHTRAMMDFFGWNSPAMAARYIESVNTITVA